MHRRTFVTTVFAAPIAGAIPSLGVAGAVAEGDFPVSHTTEEWREMLDDAAFDVMRQGGTERPFTSPLNDVTEAGTFHCKGCDQALYRSETKFKSGTGWPSFYAPIDGAVGNMPDRSWFVVRTEEHCARCGSHMGHVFDDGPEPTGKRHCINGVAMVFRPTGSGEPVVG